MVAKPIHILNGPNLNLLGSREPEIYGTSTLADIERMCAERLGEYDLEINFEQSNDEGALVDMVQAARTAAGGLILNAGAYTHTSIA
ncbi:MAG: type II 3-dehydroquinate dehydratase, partial [Pseudomonadota bacterium]|nr:type II 3-dehydroquinate dehydratase [Pseudomonadota bacterium]